MSVLEKVGEIAGAERFLPNPRIRTGSRILWRSAQYVAVPLRSRRVALEFPEWLLTSNRSGRPGCRHSGTAISISQYGAILRPEAWRTDMSELRRSVAELGGRWWRFLSGRWRNAKKSLAAICVTAAPPPDQTAQTRVCSTPSQNQPNAPGRIARSRLNTWRRLFAHRGRARTRIGICSRHKRIGSSGAEGHPSRERWQRGALSRAQIARRPRVAIRSGSANSTMRDKPTGSVRSWADASSNR